MKLVLIGLGLVAGISIYVSIKGIQNKIRDIKIEFDEEEELW